MFFRPCFIRLLREIAVVIEVRKRLGEWRRRESNPHPKAVTCGIYTFIQFA